MNAKIWLSDQILVHQFLEPILLKLTHQCDVVSWNQQQIAISLGLYTNLTTTNKKKHALNV